MLLWLFYHISEWLNTFFSATRPNCLHRRKNENEKKSRDILSHFVSYHIVENNLLERLFFRL